MHDIFIKSNDKDYDFNSFSHELINICNQHLNNDRAFAFAFILYDFRNPNLRKVLDDYDYWLALNEISGRYLTVFSLNFQMDRQVQNQIARYPSFKKNEIGYLSSINIDTNPSQASNQLISRYFGNIEVKYPSILFFQVNQEVVTDTLLIELNEEKIEQSFLELKKYIYAAVEALNKITPENRNNLDVIFDNLEISVNATKKFEKVKRITQKAGGLIGLLSSIKGLFP